MNKLILLVSLLLLTACGEGAMERYTTFSGLYTVCKPDGYPVVCFMDADSAKGGAFCLPLEEVGGQCLK